MFKRLTAALYLRHLARDCTAIATALAEQNVLLTRLADRWAPLDPPTDRSEVREDTGVSHLDADDAWRALEYVARTQRDTGHVPEDEEVLIYLADEQTRDLDQRLTARAGELARLREAREW
jgi:hypothetical protein